MTSFTSLFRKAAAPIPPTLEQRIAMLDTGSPDFVLGTALGTDQEALRLAAIQRLPDGEALRGLAGLSSLPGITGAPPASLQRAAQMRLAELVESGSLDFPTLCARSTNHGALLAVAAQCSADRLGQALATIRDPADIARLVLEGSSSRVRQLAAEGIHDPAQLRQLIKQVRDRDKSVYKILKQKMDALNATQRIEAEIAAETTAVCASLEMHSHRIFDAHYTSNLDQLKARWGSFGNRPTADQQARAAAAADRCHEVIAGHIRLTAQLAVQQEAERAALQAAEEAREHERQAARESAATQAEALAQRRREESALRDAEEAARVRKLEADAQIFRQLGGLIRQAKGALEAGNTQRAAGLRRAIDEKLPGAPALPVHLSRGLQQLDGQLIELKQWKDYAVAPKRIELIAEMEALIGCMDEPRLLADKIKALQEDWRTTAKGIVSDAPEEWERFHRASQSAYQPCKEYFEALAVQRNQNLAQRTKILERLMAFESAQGVERPDWRLIASVLREAPLEWRRYHPVDREPGRAIQQTFDDAMGRLQSKLGAWHEGNVADKQGYINRARQLLAQEDGREAIEAVKQLQRLWKETGPAPHDQEQNLWNEFRGVCDDIFQRRQQAYADHAASLEAGRAKALGLCEAAEQSADLAGHALLDVQGKIPEWRAAFEALGELPRADSSNLKSRFESAIDLCLSRIAAQQARDASMSFANLLEAGRHVRSYEWALRENAAPAACETSKQAAADFIANVPRWPRGGLQAVRDALAKAESAPGADLDVRERALRILCIRSEIECGIASPPEDDGLRREYQVQRLMQQMGQGIQSSDDDWEARGLEWIRVGAVAPSVHHVLHDRFLRCWNLRRIPKAQGAEGGGRSKTVARR